jgi:hypothetical protein
MFTLTTRACASADLNPPGGDVREPVIHGILRRIPALQRQAAGVGRRIEVDAEATNSICSGLQVP